jgi:hypothetical protein
VKPTKFFSILDYLVGREIFFNILKDYYQTWKFKHVDLKSLQSVCEKIYGKNLDWFFEQWINGTPKVDYACSQIKSQRQHDSLWQTEVTIKKIGDGIVPVETEAITEKNDTITKVWDGNEDQVTLSFFSREKINKVRLDPRDIILDQNRFNNGTPQFKLFLYPDFPSMYYLPRDTYSLFLWPRIWYNEVDGLKLGIKLFGSYLNRYYVTRNYLWYNLKSEQFDYNFGYSMPWDEIDRSLWRHIYFRRIEGRFSLNVNLNYQAVQSFAQPPTHSFRFGFSHFHLFDEAYDYRLLRINHRNYKITEWQTGDINKIYFTFNLDNSVKNPRFNGDVSLYSASRYWNSDFDYTKFAAKLDYDKITSTGKIRWQVRSFLGLIRPANQVPVQDRLSVAGANAIQRFDYYYLRSPGSYPVWLNYHLPGDGNLRGYINEIDNGHGFLSSDGLLTANIDVSFRRLHLLFPDFLQNALAGVDFKIFFDGGRVSLYQAKDQFLFDAGIGLLVNKMILGKLRKVRFEFPLWVSQPNLNNFAHHESNWQFRWLMSFQ